MKKVLYAFTVFLIFFAVSSCTKKSVVKSDEISFQDSMELSGIPGKIDFDFTKMNYNMLNSITFEMLTEPEKYIDKSIKISGNYYSNQYEGTWYHSVFIWDATGCCPAGLSFIPSNSVKEKLDSLQQDEEITVTGVMKLISTPDDLSELVCIALAIETK